MPDSPPPPSLAQATLEAFIENLEDATVGKTLDGTITIWNPAAERLYGYSAEEVLGKSVALLIPPDRPNELADIMDRVRQGQHIEHFETIRLRKDGFRLNVSVSISPITGSGGQVIGAATIARDISAQKRREDDIAEVLFRDLLEMAPDPILITKGGIITMLNRQASREFGYGSEELLGQSYRPPGPAASAAHPRRSAE